MTFQPMPSEPSENDWLDPFVESLSSTEQEAILSELESEWIPLPHQEPPTSKPWDLWLLVGGRGSGKTDADSNYVNEHALGPACIDGPTPHRIGIIAPTHEDAKKTCVVGDSGLRSHNPDIRFTPGGKVADLIWPNGAIANLYGAFTPEDVERLRGPQHCLIWAEELAAWRYLEDCWDQAMFGLRLGDHPHAVASSTPKPRAKFKELMGAATTAMRHATTDDNPYLHKRVRSELYRKYGGTRLGQQELLAKILEDIEGALWSRKVIRYGPAPIRHVGSEEVVDLRRTIVSIDPAGTYGPDADETGIIAAGLGADKRAYVLEDLSGRYHPTDWALRAIALYKTLNADAIVAETNFGGDMVENTLRGAGYDGRFIKVTASKGKRVRAEPIAGFYEQFRVTHVRPFPELEDQLCNFTPESTTSPDRLDALVWCLTELMLGAHYSGSAESFSVAA